MSGDWTELREALRAANAAGRSLPVFFRDDDANDDRPSLRQLLRISASRQVPINLEVIPGLLTDDGVGLLREAAAVNPELIGLNQHGWRHENHEPTGRKSEFGQSRDLDQQHRDISAGRQVMEKAFGKDFFPVFTPPWNRCTAVTHEVLVGLGFAAISDLARHDWESLKGIVRIPATLDIIDWKGSRDLRPGEEILAQLVEQIGAGGPVGILLHHQVMSQTAFDFIARLIDEMIDAGGVRFHLFQTMLKTDHE